MRIFLCGVTENQVDNIDKLTSNIWEHVDGLIFVDGGSTDGTRELLEDRVGEGAVLYRKWTNDHDLQMSEILRQGPMQIGDWFILRDSMERFNDDFAKSIVSFLVNARNQNIKSIYSHGKGFAFEYYDDMFFLGSPHWGLQNARHEAIDLKDYFKDEKEYSYRLKDGEEGGRPIHNFVDHFVKYYYVYGRSNHTLLGREHDRKAYQEAELNRQQFRVYCNKNIGLDFTVESLLDYLKKDQWKNDKEFVAMFNKEKILKDFYRWHVLKHPLEELEEKNKTHWEFK